MFDVVKIHSLQLGALDLLAEGFLNSRMGFSVMCLGIVVTRLWQGLCRASRKGIRMNGHQVSGLGV